ncbi:MAG TPA: GNAT family N-acetyltransferase [Candidatus Angelobacter sp.]|nr:GNAT family N-acetyltransferase [Candidatus Angelobacter sp.]
MAYLWLPVYQHVDSRASGEHPVLGIALLIFVPGLQIQTLTSADGLLRLRPMWEGICTAGHFTLFQNFGLNLLVARMFAGREQPYIICAEASYGAVIIPAVVRHAGASLRLLGDELFDYRCFLHQGEPGVLRAALAVLAERGLPLEVVALREKEASTLPQELPLVSFCVAPTTSGREISAEQFALKHLRLARNLRRLGRLGFALHSYQGDYPGLLRFIYQKKAAQSVSSLFHDPLRIEFMVNAATILPNTFEIFTLEDEASIVAAVVTLREDGCRRFYTGWFAPELEKHSPALSLIYEVTRQSLEAGLDCDYMTGEQPYKLRLATSAVQLYRLGARAEELAAAGRSEAIQAA